VPDLKLEHPVSVLSKLENKKKARGDLPAGLEMSA
jgi:hypothetical protein